MTEKFGFEKNLKVYKKLNAPHGIEPRHFSSDNRDANRYAREYNRVTTHNKFFFQCPLSNDIDIFVYN